VTTQKDNSVVVIGATFINVTTMWITPAGEDNSVVVNGGHDIVVVEPS